MPPASHTECVRAATCDEYLSATIVGGRLLGAAALPLDMRSVCENVSGVIKVPEGTVTQTEANVSGKVLPILIGLTSQHYWK